MIATLARSRSRRIRSPRLRKVMARLVVSGSRLRGNDSEQHEYLCFRWGGEIGAAAARQQLAGLVEDVGLGSRELAAELDHLAVRNQVARRGGAVIVDVQVDGRYAAAGTPDQGPVARDIDERSEDA